MRTRYIDEYKIFQIKRRILEFIVELIFGGGLMGIEIINEKIINVMFNCF